MGKYKAVLFDLDGTILDTSEGILLSIKETAEIMGLKELEPEVLRTFIGPPVEWSFEDKYGIHGDDLKKAASLFRERYSKINLCRAKPSCSWRHMRILPICIWNGGPDSNIPR